VGVPATVVPGKDDFADAGAIPPVEELILTPVLAGAVVEVDEAMPLTVLLILPIKLTTLFAFMFCTDNCSL